MEELEPGRVVAGFVVKERLGKGGMGEVYLVHDQKLSVDRALKVIAGDIAGDAAQARAQRERFLREARVLARLRHPNIIPVHEIGEIGGHPFIVMSYFPARDGKKWARLESPGAERIRKVALQFASALAHAHGQGVLHRDIKVGNVLIGADDEAMLIDFGLAKSKTCAKVTRTGRAMGTYNYLAPEYVVAAKGGGGEHTERTDLWSFGCLLYALTCKRSPFEGDDIKVLGLIEECRFKPVKEARPDVPDAWAKLIHELMEPEPTKRVQSARVLVERLQALDLTAACAVLPPPHFSGVVVPLAAEAPPRVERVEGVDGELPEAPLNATTVAERRAPTGEDASLFEHSSTASVPTPQATQLPQPSFRPPAESVGAARSRARRSLLFPFAAAATVFCVGGGFILWADSAAATRSRSKQSTYVDPEELQRKQRAQQELADLDVERGRRTPPQPPREARSVLPTVTIAPPPELPQPAPTPPAPPRRASSPRANVGAQVITAAAVDDPWARRYGSRTSFNSSVAPAEVASSPVATTAAVAGVKIPVRVREAIANSPPGPVIALVERVTKVGDIELPKGAEVHGSVVGTSGQRLLVDFTFAMVAGRKVPLNGCALGLDGRAGVPASKSLGGMSSIAAGGAAGAAGAVVDLAAGVVGNAIGQGAVRGAGAAARAKVSVIDNDEQLVAAERDSHFLIYIKSGS